MPFDPLSYKTPQEPIRQVLPANYYTVEITDIDLKEEENKFKPGEMRQQFIVYLKVTDGKYKDTELRCWVDDSLLPQEKKKNPGSTLPKLLKAVTGKTFGVANRAEVTPVFILTIIGSKLRVNVEPKTTTSGTEVSFVTSFAPLEK